MKTRQESQKDKNDLETLRKRVNELEKSCSRLQQTELELREAQKLLEMIMRHSRDAIHIGEWNAGMSKQRLVMCNDSYEEMTGRTREELASAKNLDVFGKSIDGRDWRKERYGLWLKGKSRTGLNTFLRPDGKENYIEWSSVDFEMEGRNYVVSIDRDVTDRIKKERALRESHEQLKMVLKHSRDGINIVTFDPDTGIRRLVVCNDKFVEMTGRCREELMSIRDINIIGESPITPEFCRKRWSEGKIRTGVSSWKRPDGKENYHEWTGSLIESDGNHYIIGIDRDVTERIKAEKALRLARSKIMNAREQERRRLAGELHDSTAQKLVALQLAIEDVIAANKECQYEKTHNKLVASCESCSELIRDVRNICQGLFPPTLESLGLITSLRGLGSSFATRQMKFTVHCLPEIEKARFQRDTEIALFRIAQEATNNALNHGKAKSIKVTLSTGNREISLAICDDGIGFDARAIGGGHMGVNIMRERAHVIGGKLDITSKSGKTCVKVVAPLEPPTEEDGGE